MLLNLVFFAFLGFAQTTLLVEADTKDYSMEVELNQRSIPTQESSEVSVHAKSGENTLKVCFAGTGSIGDFSKRSELRVRLKSEDSKLLRVINYFGVGQKCRTASFYIEPKVYAQFNTNTSPAPVVATAEEEALPTDRTGDLATAEPIVRDQNTTGIDSEPTMSPEPIADAPIAMAEESSEMPSEAFPEESTEVAAEPGLEEASFDSIEPTGDELVEIPEDVLAMEESFEDLPIEEGLEEIDIEEGFEALDSQELASSSQEFAQPQKGLLSLLLGLLFAFKEILLLAILILSVSLYRIFDRVGLKAWQGLVPILNLSILLKITRLPSWNLPLYFVPVLNILTHFKVSKELAKAFGLGNGFAAGLFALPFIFYPLLAFGKHEYQYILEEHDDDYEGDLEVTSIEPEPTMTAVIEEDHTAVTEVGYGQDEATEIA